MLGWVVLYMQRSLEGKAMQVAFEATFACIQIYRKTTRLSWEPRAQAQQYCKNGCGLPAQIESRPDRLQDPVGLFRQLLRCTRFELANQSDLFAEVVQQLSQLGSAQVLLQQVHNVAGIQCLPGWTSSPDTAHTCGALLVAPIKQHG